MRRLAPCLAPLALLIACSGDDSSDSTTTGGATAATSTSTSTSTATSTSTSTSTQGGSATATQGSATDTSSTSTTGAETSSSASGSTSSATDTSGTTGDGSTSAAMTTGSTTSDTDPTTTGGVEPCGEPGGMVEFSYIWIANSPEGTVSKIDTVTLQEVGRYRVRPQGGGQPSRTSVNLRGDMVIGSRVGGVTKIWARESDCKDTNGIPGIQTSKGANDVLPWGQEECVAWYADYNFVSERAIAWTTGVQDPQTCEFNDAKVWVGATADSSVMRIMRLSGDDGTLDAEVMIPGTKGSLSRSPYGAAVDADNDVWMVNGYCNATLFEVRNDDLSYELIQLPQGLCAYGITVDSKGYIWIGGYQNITGRLNPETKQWDFVQAQGLGIQEDQNGHLWLGAYGQNAVIEIDGETLQVIKTVPVPTTGQSKGVGVDFYGYIWIVSDAGNAAVRMDPQTNEMKTYNGLSGPYSYSDMTGWGLKNVIPQ